MAAIQPTTSLLFPQLKKQKTDDDMLNYDGSTIG